jgi:hypothetical protein
MGLLFTIAAGPRRSSHSQARVPRDSWPYFTASDSRLSQPGESGPRIYIPQEQGGPVIKPRHWVPFSSPPVSRRAAMEVFDPASTRALLKAVRVRVILWLTVSLSVCLCVEPCLGLMTRYLFFDWKLQSCPYGAPSLTRGRVCHFLKSEIQSRNIHIQPYLTGNTLRLRYKAQPVNAV